MLAEPTVPHDLRVRTSLLLIACSIVIVSASAAVAGRGVGINTAFTFSAGVLVIVVLLAAVLGWGRSAARDRVMGSGVVVALISGIQLAQLWNDELAASEWLAGSILLVLALLGTACLSLGRRMEVAERS